MLIKPITGWGYNHQEGWHLVVNSTKYFNLRDALVGMGIHASLRHFVEEFDTKLYNASIHLANDYGQEFKKADPLLDRAREIRFYLETIDSNFGPLLDSIAKKGLARA